MLQYLEAQGVPITDPGNYQDLAEKLSQYDISDRNTIMAMAAQRGDIDVVERMLELGANNYNVVMADAAGVDRIDIVQLMLQHGANNYDEVLEFAAQIDNADIVNLMLQFDIDPSAIDAALKSATRGISLSTVEVLLQHHPSVEAISQALEIAREDKRIGTLARQGKRKAANQEIIDLLESALEGKSKLL